MTSKEWATVCKVLGLGDMKRDWFAGYMQAALEIVDEEAYRTHLQIVAEQNAGRSHGRTSRAHVKAFDASAVLAMMARALKEGK